MAAKTAETAGQTNYTVVPVADGLANPSRTWRALAECANQLGLAGHRVLDTELRIEPGSSPAAAQPVIRVYFEGGL